MTTLEGASIMFDYCLHDIHFLGDWVTNPLDDITVLMLKSHRRTNRGRDAIQLS